MQIIIKGGATHKPFNKPLENLSKDELHHRRKRLEGELKNTLFSKDQMNWRDCQDKDARERRVKDYMKAQRDNEPKMREWSNINREFKKRGIEGKPQCADFIRDRKSVKYD